MAGAFSKDGDGPEDLDVADYLFFSFRKKKKKASKTERH